MWRRLKSVVTWTLRLTLAAGVLWVGYAGVTWLRYGAPSRPSPAEADVLLDAFIPTYDVVERHEVRIEAPAAVTLATAREWDLTSAPLARVIFRGRELLFRSRPDDRDRPRALMPLVLSIGWGVLADVPDREVVVGAVTQPWKANVIFTAIAPARFASFDEPGFVKIVWTLRADPSGERASTFRTETRVTATDLVARAKFRRYWAFLSPGIILIRRAALDPLKREAERRARSNAGSP